MVLNWDGKQTTKEDHTVNLILPLLVIKKMENDVAKMWETSLLIPHLPTEGKSKFTRKDKRISMTDFGYFID